MGLELRVLLLLRDNGPGFERNEAVACLNANQVALR